MSQWTNMTSQWNNHGESQLTCLGQNVEVLFISRTNEVSGILLSVDPDELFLSRDI